MNRSGGVLYSPAQVRHALKERGLKAGKARPFKPVSTQSGQSGPRVARVFKSGQSILTNVNQVWGSDITYLKVMDGKFLLFGCFSGLLFPKDCGVGFKLQFIL